MNISEAPTHKSPVAIMWRPQVGVNHNLYERVRLIEAPTSPDGYLTVFTFEQHQAVSEAVAVEIVPVQIFPTGETQEKSRFTDKALVEIEKSWGLFCPEARPTSTARGKMRRSRPA